MSKFLSLALDVKDLELQLRLNKHHSRNEYFNGGDYNNNNLFIPPPSLPQPPQPLNIPVPQSFQVICLTIIGLHHCLCCHLHHQQGNHSICLFSIMNRHQYFQLHQCQQKKKKISTATNTMQTMSRDRLIGELEWVVEKEKPKEKLQADNDVIFFLLKISTILDDDEYEKKKKEKSQRMTK